MLRLRLDRAGRARRTARRVGLRRADRRRLRPGRPMPYGPHTAGDRERMLAALGIASVDELFADIPEALRASPLDLPEPEPELELAARLQGLAGRNRTDLASFLGAGVYRHWSPPAVDQILLRGEWYTAYTPYQPEISQGTLQSIYEYESLLAELVDLDVVSASHYDGAAATAEAALMTCRATRRERVLVSAAVHPHYRQTLETYFGGGLELDDDPARGRGRRRRDDGPRGARAAAGRRERRSPASSPAQPSFLGPARADGRDRPARPRRRAPCSSASSSRSRSRSSPRPGRTARTSRPARASRSGSRRSTAARTSGSSPRPTRWSARSPAGSSG